uniref:Reverse transcriptase domain-containing protein n=1 Tax=Tanacetum cinerariifolium TaxID=118510 RepID=A0A6L2NYK1_TANCI|nr:reverse transcriptase domain-containing protein [Tanacetum cinerariifolium]
MSAMANTTPIVTTVMKPATNPRDVDATLRVNNQDFYKEYYEDILPIIMDKKYVKDPVEIHNIKQKDGKTIKDFMERFKVEIGHMKGTPECMWIFRFMHGVNNLKLTKRLNEHVPKTMEEMMITTTAFIRGEAATTSKKNGHTSWRTHDQSKRQTLEKRADLQGHPREGIRSSRFTPLTRTPKEILVAEARKFRSPPPMIKGITRMRLLVTIGDADHSTRAWMNFMIVRSLSPYNGIIERPIQFAESDEEKTTFHTGQMVYCYTKMPFGLKTGGATYQRLVNKAFDIQIAPNPKEELIVYMSASYGAISAVLMTKKGTVYTSVYFVSRTLQGPKLNYTPMEKLVLSLVFAAKRLQMYFQAHPIVVITDQPIKQIMSHPDVAGRLQKWSVLLGEHNITYRSRTSVKGQVLADFLIEVPDESLLAALVVETQQELWTLFTDGSSCVDGSGAGLILTSPEGTEDIRHQRGKHDQISRKGQNPVHRLHQLFYKTSTTKQKQEIKCPKQNCVNQLCALIQTGLGRNTQRKISTTKGDDNRSRGRWTDVDDTNNRIFERIDSSPWRSFFTQWLRCIRPLQAEYVIREIHEGSCSMHSGPRLVVAKAIRLGYYWPTMHRDAQDMIRTCNDCQIHCPITRNLQQLLTLIMAPWPFYKWGIDIAGLFPEGPGEVKILIVAMDYFTKWIEAKAMATITGSQVKKFMWDNIVCCFGLPGEIISDNGKQFSDNPFKDWCDKLNITQRFTSVKHPQSNRLVERANRSLGEGIKARLGEGNKNWVEELPHFLWAHRTMIKSRHGDTPFSLTYGTEVVIHAEIGIPTYRCVVVDVVYNDEELQLNLDMLEERRERAVIREAKSKLKMTKYYNARARGVAFKPGDFVYRNKDASHAVDGGKLGPK